MRIRPRKIVDGQITKYNFFSFSGFFCCNRRDYLNLGQAYITYFNTIKLLIIIFVLMTLIHLALIKYCFQFSSVYNFNDDRLLKTTLGNTIITYFNTTYFFFERNKDYSSSEITFDCGENLINSFVGAIRHYDIDQNKFRKIQKGRAENEFYINNEGTILDMDYISNNLDTYSDNYDRKTFKILTNDDIHVYIYSYGSENNYTESLNYMYNYFKDFSKNFEYYSGRNYYYENMTDIYYYTCRKNISSINNQNQYYYGHEFEEIILGTTLSSLIVIIVFYFIYKKGISRDKKESEKNKILINNYTLVLHKLKISSEDFNQEINDLISFLNDILKNYKHLFISSDNNNSKEIADLNIFDISLSNVNEKKVELFEKIKSLENKIEDIINDNDTIKNKLKNNLRGFYQSMHDLVVDDSEIKGKDDKIKEEDLNKDEMTPENEEGYNLEKQIKIGKTKTQKNEMTSKITTDVIEMHKEYKLSNYVDIYITFRNQKIPIFLYDMYNKRKITRFFYFLFCQCKKIKKYYYKNQWLNFNLATENPSDIKWENCYISTGKKWGRRLLSVLISFIFIVIITAIMSALNIEENQLNSIIVVILTQGINLGSSYVLSKFTKFEKYSSKSKEIFSDIRKYYWLNLLVSMTIFFKKENFFIFSYLEIENYYILNKIIMINMFYSIFTSQLSPLAKLKDKIKYEKLYVGPDFPFEERYAKILVNLSICLFYGTNCPIIYFFFLCFLLVTFLVDKFMMINYYKIPPFYGSILSKKILNYFVLNVFIYFYGLSYNLSNPYIIRNNESIKGGLFYDYYNYYGYSNDDFSIIYYFINPFTLFYYFYCEGDYNKNRFTFFYYNFNSDILPIHLIIFLLIFVNPTTFIRKKLTPKAKFLSFLNVSPAEIGNIYSLEVLEKYYEIKKLQLFNLIIECDSNYKNIDDYEDLINNYICGIKYIQLNIENKNSKKEKIIDINPEIIEDEFSPLKGEDLMKGSHLQIAGDISYNQSFISKYEMYNSFSLMKNI